MFILAYPEMITIRMRYEEVRLVGYTFPNRVYVEWMQYNIQLYET